MSKQSAYFRAGSEIGGHLKNDIRRELSCLSGVLSVSIGNENTDIAVDFDNSAADIFGIKSKLNDCGCSVRLERTENHPPD